MASKLKLDISCPLCSEIYKDPVILSCSHSFCKACLQQYRESKPPSQCPVCKKTSSKDSFLPNLALKTICESLSGIVLQEKGETQIASPDDEQPVCLDSKEPAAAFVSEILADQQDAVHVLLNDSGEPSLQQALARAREEFDSLENVVLNIAVTGETGSGKSSLVNAIRDLQDADEEAAAVGVTETTMVPTMYSHSRMPNLRIWDLPGIGSVNFNASNYMKQVKFQTYDVFIIVSATRFKENELKLAKEIKKKNKYFYFVRTKIDQDVENTKRQGLTQDQTIKQIQEDCVENLCGLSCPIFLVSSCNRDKFQFQELLEALEKDLPIHKKYILVMAVPVYSSQSLKKKYGAFKKAVWVLTIASGAIGGIPVPGLSMAVDVAMIVSFLTKCYFSFGLDDTSLNILGQRVNKDILKMVKESELVMALADKSLVTKIAIRLGAAGGIETVCSFVPVAGNTAAAGISFVTTRAVLQEMLDELYSIAKKVIEMAGLQ